MDEGVGDSRWRTDVLFFIRYYQIGINLESRTYERMAFEMKFIFLRVKLNNND